MNRKPLALALSLCLLLSCLVPMGAGAEDGGTTPATTAETTQATETTTEATTEATTVPTTVAATEATTVPTTTAPEGTTQPVPSPAVALGDTLELPAGTVVYKDPADAQGHTLHIGYRVRVEEVSGDWYRFTFTGTNLAEGVGSLIHSGYTWVRAQDAGKATPTETTAPATEATTAATVATDPQGIPLCDCTQGADRELGQHPATCARYAYLLENVIGDSTAQQLFDGWEELEADLREDILSILSTRDPARFQELEGLLEGEDGQPRFETFAGTSAQGVSAVISAREGLFPAGTTLNVWDEDFPTTLSASDGNVLGVVAVNISFGGVQPGGNVVVTLNIPAAKVPRGANMVEIYHFGEEDVELITTQYLTTTSAAKSITFGTDSFSTYAAVFLSGHYNAKKMEDHLPEGYSIETFPVTLFDYDPAQMNSQLKQDAGGGDAFYFRGYGDDAPNEGGGGINDSGELYAKQGIVQEQLSDAGTPVFNYVSNNGGTVTGKTLFDPDTSVTGKTVYKDTNFQFIYNQATGYYTYKSSANHAQYNKSNNTVELYADTLSTKNNRTGTVDLTTHKGEYQMTGISTDGGVLKATVKYQSGDRLDPYISFSVPEGTKASNINRIYIKAKIPASVGTNKLKVYFDNDDDRTGDHYKDEKSFTCQYTATGDWIEFVIDTSESTSYWSGTIHNLRVDPFDETYNNSLDRNTTYAIEISEISFIKEYEGYVTYGGFYPFSDITKSYPGNNDAFSVDSWKTALGNDTQWGITASRSIFNPTGTTAELTENLYFGMTAEFDFYIPVSKQEKGEDIIFHFDGDDDMWVFVDGQLALDIGGGHGAISGTIDFTNSKATVSSAVTVTGYNSNSGGASEKVKTLDSALTAPGKHTIKIFYMERCGSVSNCFMKFNLPQTPEGTLSVSKSVKKEGGSTIEALQDQEYTFTIQTAWQGAAGTETLTGPIGYTVYEDGKVSDEKQVGNDGTFTLTPTQTAYFTIPENYKVTITETQPSSNEIQGYQWTSGSLEVNGTKQTGLSGEITTAMKTDNKFSFTNVYNPLYGQIVIEKSGISHLDQDGAAKQQSSVFQVTNKDGTFRLEVVIVGNGSKVIDHVPVGEYTVTEVTDWTWRYGGQEGKTVTVQGDDSPKAKFVNKREEQYWLSGDNYKKNHWTTPTPDAATD